MILKRDFNYPVKNANRPLHIWLPDDYYDCFDFYPVMYFFDGHNLFLDEDATYGKSWGLREFMEGWEKELIIVGVTCSMTDRLVEYCPYHFKKGFLGEIVGTGDKKYEYALSTVARQFPGKAAVRLCFDPKLANRVYAGADLYLMPSKSEPCGLSQLIAMRYGTVPVVSETGGLRDTVPAYNPETKEGRGFTFQSYNADDFLDAIDRAVALYYEDREEFKALAKRDMEIDFSWQVPAGEYMQLYAELISK